MGIEEIDFSTIFFSISLTSWKNIFVFGKILNVLNASESMQNENENENETKNKNEKKNQNDIGDGNKTKILILMKKEKLIAVI